MGKFYANLLSLERIMEPSPSPLPEGEGIKD